MGSEATVEIYKRIIDRFNIFVGVVSMNNEFKLQFYFNMYKDYPVINTQKFTYEFIKKHGKFNYLRELILMIEKYQRQRYGNLVDYYANNEYVNIISEKRRRH